MHLLEIQILSCIMCCAMVNFVTMLILLVIYSSYGRSIWSPNVQPVYWTDFHYDDHNNVIICQDQFCYFLFFQAFILLRVCFKVVIVVIVNVIGIGSCVR